MKNLPDGFGNYKEDEIWINDTYTVFVNRGIEVSAFRDETNAPLTVCWLSIKRIDRSAIRDWRDLQWIKNQIVGVENEGCELYPAESRLLDTANQYHLWVFEDPRFRFPFGMWQRQVAEKVLVDGTSQRRFPKNRTPPDLKESEEKIREELEKYRNGNAME